MSIYATFEEIRDRWEKFPSMEDKLYLLHRVFYPIPVRVSFEPWEGFEIRLSAERPTTCYGPRHYIINIDDITTVERLWSMFKDVDHELIEILNAVSFREKLSGMVSFSEEKDMDIIMRKWRKFRDWVAKRYPGFGKDWGDEGHLLHWSTDPAVKLPKNSVAWAARVILGGIQPSEAGIAQFKLGNVEISPSGLMTLSEASGMVSRWHFPECKPGSGNPTALDSFGLSGSISAAMQRAFGDDKDVVECNKVPEQWEVDANLFIGYKTAKKSLLNRTK